MNIQRCWTLLASCLAFTTAPWIAYAQRWHASAALGTDRWFSPEVGGQAFLVFDLRGSGVVGGGDARVYYNTETLQVGVERVPLGSPRVQLSAALRAEGALAGVLRYYSANARRRPERGFFASYALAFATVEWLPASSHAIAFTATARRWLFAREEGVTSNALLLPPDAWVFEPRLRYTYWALTSPGEEWQAHVIHPRITGFAAGVEAGLDVRSDAQPWGTLAGVDDGRNRVGDVIVTVRQWARFGAQVHRAFRLQVEQSASWGEGEDDLTRPRVGGMSPYVVPVPGLPWPALLSERHLAAQLSGHWRPWIRHTHEFGVALGGGAFNDTQRIGRLDLLGFAAGAALFADLRFGRFFTHLRAGYALPVGSFSEGHHLSAMAALGVRLF